MGRQTRQGRRTTQRRQDTRPAHTPQNKTQSWQIVAGALLVVAVAVVLIVLAIKPGGSSTNVTKAATQGQNTAKKVDGFIGCNAMEQITYHVHAHVTLLVAGKQQSFDRYAGLNYGHDCLYWLHVHDQTGIIHIEAPHKILPTLGNWYDVMKQPLSTTQVGSAKVKPGQHLKMWVNGKPYTGDPRKIVLTQHKDIWLEIGPPFKKPTPFNFAANNV